MRLLAAFLMAVGMVMLSSWAPEPVSASDDCGYEECRTADPDRDDLEGPSQICQWVSRSCPRGSSGSSGSQTGTVSSHGNCDDPADAPCSSDGGTATSSGGGQAVGQRCEQRDC